MLNQKCKEIFEGGDLPAMHFFIKNLISDGSQNDVDTYRKSPLMYACEFGNVDLVKTLLDADVDVNIASVDGDTAIMYAIRNKNIKNSSEIVALLLKYGADVDDVINKKNEYPLLVAAKLGNKQCFKLLLPYSAWCYNHIDKQGYSAIAYANRNNCKAELDRFLFYSKVKKRIQYFGSLLLRAITLPFMLIERISSCFFKKLDILESPAVSILKGNNVVPEEFSVKFNNETLQQYDAAFEAFAQDIKNHVELTVKKSEYVVSHLGYNLNNLKSIVSQLEQTATYGTLDDIIDAETRYEAAERVYTLYNNIHAMLLSYRKRFEHYNFFNNSHSYEKTRFFNTSRKYIKYAMLILESLDTKLDSIELSKTENNSEPQSTVLQFSQPLESNLVISDLQSLGEKLNGLSLKKMRLN